MKKPFKRDEGSIEIFCLSKSTDSILKDLITMPLLLSRAYPSHSSPACPSFKTHIYRMVILYRVHFCHPTHMHQPWTRALPTSAWTNPGGTQTTTSTSHLAYPCVTATCLGNGTASPAWPGMPCPPSASLKITVAPTLLSGSTAATLIPTKALSACLCAPASMTTAASGTPVLMWRPALGDTLSTVCRDPQSASMFTVAVSEHL